MNLYEKLKPSIEKVLSFHIKNAPGVILGVYMVDYAHELLDSLYPDRNSYTLNAISETRVCLIDSIQVLTGCTVGNKYLRLDALDFGRYALILYNRDTSIGFRVYVDMNKIDKNKLPQLYAFFAKTRNYQNVSRDELNEQVINEIHKAQRSILSYQKVKVNLPRKEPLVPANICSNCGESYLISDSNNDNKLCNYCLAKLNNKPLVFDIME